MDPIGMLEVLCTLRADVLLYRGIEFKREEPSMLLAEGSKDILLQVGDGIALGKCGTEVRDLRAY